MDQYLYVLIIAMGIFLCPFCFLNFEINILPKIKKCFEKKPKNNENNVNNGNNENNENNLNENLIDN